MQLSLCYIRWIRMGRMASAGWNSLSRIRRVGGGTIDGVRIRRLGPCA